MGKLHFYVLWSLCDVPRQFISKSRGRCFQAHIPLPLPKQLVIFGLGEWTCKETTISAEVVVSDLQAQIIGTLSSQVKCLTWEGDWSNDVVRVGAERGRRGVYGKIVLRVCGQLQENISVLSSSPLVERKCLYSDQHSLNDPSSTLQQSVENETMVSSSSHLGDDVCDAEIQVNKIDKSDSPHPAAWPTDKTPRRTVISRRGHLTWSSEDMDSLTEHIDQASTPKKQRLHSLNRKDEISVQIKNENRVSVSPSQRWCHSMCLSDPNTAILIGGETSEQNYCHDSLWKLELDSDFWFPVNSSASGPLPPCARGHTATYDSDSKAVFVYGGLREGQRYSELYILSTLTWKWKLVTPSHALGDKSCSNALYIFNPEYELWYQPIVDGDRPLPRFGHSATLLSHKLVIFGGRKTAAYLNDLHVLDLGFMEYTAVKCANMPPVPRGFHAALPVLDNRILVSGGCSAIGVLQDVHIFNIDTSMWSSVASPPLCSKPRAGHSMINLGRAFLTDAEDHRHGEHTNIQCTLLVFGGSDCSGSFYNDTVKCTVVIAVDK
ncbi:rab9 effector protein with kelch motifs isoform X2 [Melanotaenia boesemani]|uniref:rab9 effector protein with kelch motifs isoform X2 n=1 Tax=Melanotaenia boesemani TaxID=1250792 RepID=UPI001C046085|nr:rab9 effector protein with kelch motifs isoform X2 [Melanotaenia boesemani]